MKIIISNNLQITEAPETLLRKIRDTFTLENPAYLANAKTGGDGKGGLKHPMNFVSCAHVYTPCSVISKIITYFVSAYDHRGLFNSYCKSRSLSPSENAGILTILPFLMSLCSLFAILNIHIFVIIEYIFLPIKREVMKNG